MESHCAVLADYHHPPTRQLQGEYRFVQIQCQSSSGPPRRSIDSRGVSRARRAGGARWAGGHSYLRERVARTAPLHVLYCQHLQPARCCRLASLAGGRLAFFTRRMRLAARDGPVEDPGEPRVWTARTVSRVKTAMGRPETSGTSKQALHVQGEDCVVSYAPALNAKALLAGLERSKR